MHPGNPGKREETRMKRFDNKTVVVTGGGGGIGGATCRRFAGEGARVAVFDLNLEAAEKVAAAIRADGGSAEAFQCDITDRASVDAAVAAAEAKLGPDRRAGQQRRLGRVQALHQDRAGAVGQADRHQPDRRAAHAPRRAARHGGAQERAASSTSRPTRRASARPARRCTPPARAGWWRSPRPSPASTPATASPSTWSAPAPPTPRCSPTTRKAPATPRS